MDGRVLRRVYPPRREWVEVDGREAHAVSRKATGEVSPVVLERGCETSVEPARECVQVYLEVARSEYTRTLETLRDTTTPTSACTRRSATSAAVNAGNTRVQTRDRWYHRRSSAICVVDKSRKVVYCRLSRMMRDVRCQNPIPFPHDVERKSSMEKQIKTGAILRIFAKTEAVVPEAVNNLKELIRVSVHEGVTNHFQVIVAEDPRYPDHDCGKTYEALKPVAVALQSEHDITVKVNRLQSGDVFVDALNFGMHLLGEEGCTHGFVLSKEARSYIDRDTAGRMHKAIRHDGVRVAGVVLHEVASLVRMGAVSNPFSCWHIESLMQADGFPTMCAQARTDEVRPKIHISRPEEGVDEWAVLQGVEDAALAGKFSQMFGPCIAVVEPANTAAAYDVGSDPSRARRDYLKFLSKKERTEYFLKRVGLDKGLAQLAGAVRVTL